MNGHFYKQQKFGILSLRVYSSGINRFINKPIVPFYMCINSLSYATYWVPISWWKIRPREERWGPAEICQHLSNSESQLTGKTGHQWTQLLLTVSQIIQFALMFYGLNETFNMLVSKYGEVVQCGSARAIDHLEAGLKQRDVAAFVGVSQSTISKLQLRYRDTHDVKDRPRSGKPRITKDRVDCSIRLATLRNRRITARSLQMRYLGSRLHASQLKFRKAVQKPLLTAEVTIEFIDDQSCLWAVAHYWHGDILANFCWTHLSSLGCIFRSDQDIWTQLKSKYTCLCECKFEVL